jgi:predicted ATPase
MKLLSIAVRNYKCFSDPVTVSLSRLHNVFLGANNAGKTSLLECLALNVGDVPHRSSKTIARPGDPILEAHTEVSVEFEVTREELEHCIRRKWTTFSVISDSSPHRPAADVLSEIRGAETLHFTASVPISKLGRYWPSTIRQRPPAGKTVMLHVFRCARDKPPECGHFGAIDWREDSRNDDIGFLVLQEIRQSVLRLVSERRIPPSGRVRPESTLAGDASNLSTVLNTLHGQRRTFDRYELEVRRILPDITGLGIAPVSDGDAAIRIWFSDTHDRLDLSFGLNEVGTGTANVLALVYAIAMSPEPRIIIIDEPATALHPGAFRELLRLATLHSRHQYFISTHSPLALDILDAPTVAIIGRDAETRVEVKVVDATSCDDQRAMLQAVGASLQDVFGADCVIWVEGDTEVNVFRVASRLIDDWPRGIAIASVVSTSELEGRHLERMADVYAKVVRGGALVPAGLAIIMDREGRTDAQREAINKRTNGMVSFVEGVRMTENCFLESDVVSHFICSLQAQHDVSGVTCAPDAVSEFWNALHDVDHYCVTSRASNEPHWRATVHGARVLEATLGHFLNNTVEYRKVSHGHQLAQLCAQLAPAALGPIVTALRAALARQAKPRP